MLTEQDGIDESAVWSQGPNQGHLIPYINVLLSYRRWSSTIAHDEPLKKSKPTWRYQQRRRTKKSGWTRNRLKIQKWNSKPPVGTLVSKHAEERLRERGHRTIPVYKRTDQGEPIIVTYLRRKWAQQRKKAQRKKAYERAGCNEFDPLFFLHPRSNVQPQIIRARKPTDAAKTKQNKRKSKLKGKGTQKVVPTKETGTHNKKSRRRNQKGGLAQKKRLQQRGQGKSQKEGNTSQITSRGSNKKKKSTRRKPAARKTS